MIKYISFSFFLLAVLASCRKDDPSAIVASHGDGNHIPAGWTLYATAGMSTAYNATLDNAEDVWYSSGYMLQKRNADNSILDLSSRTNTLLTANGNISGLAVDNSNNLWIASTESASLSAFPGLMKFDGINFTSYNLTNSGIHNNHVNSLAIGAANVKWLGTANSLVSYDGTTWTYYDASNSFLTEFSPLVCSYGNLWIGGHNSLTRFDGSAFAKWNPANSSFPASGARIMDKDVHGNIWFVGFNSPVLWRFDGSTFTSYPVPSANQPAGSEFTAIKADAAGDIWLGGYGKLVRYSGGTWSDFPIPSTTVGTDPHGAYPGVTTYATIKSIAVKSDETVICTALYSGNNSLMIFHE